MEFHHQSVSVYFRLLLEAVTAGVEINYLSFANPSADPKRNTERLLDAIADARLIPFPDAATARLSRVAEALSLNSAPAPATASDKLAPLE